MEGEFYLVADFGVQCYDFVYYLNATLAFLFLVLLGLGLPLSMIAAMEKHRNVHRHKQLHFLVGMLHHCTDGAVLLSFCSQNLSAAYGENCRWWEAVVLLRKLFLKFVVVFVTNPTLQG